MGRDVERAESEEDLEKKRKEEEEELKAAKKRQVNKRGTLETNLQAKEPRNQEKELPKRWTAQATLDNIGVLVAVIIMVLLALVIVSFKVWWSNTKWSFEQNYLETDSYVGPWARKTLWTIASKGGIKLTYVSIASFCHSCEEEEKIFCQVDSTIMYTGHGYIPCEG